MRFITGDYSSRQEGSVTKMLEMLNLEKLQRRSRVCRLFFLFKIVEGLVPAIKPEEVLIPCKSKRTVKPKKFKVNKCSNISSRVNTLGSHVSDITALDQRRSFFSLDRDKNVALFSVNYSVSIYISIYTCVIS